MRRLPRSGAADGRGPGDPRPGPGRPAVLLRGDRRLHPGDRAETRPRPGDEGPPAQPSRLGLSASPTHRGWPWTTSRRRSSWSGDQGDALAGRGLARIRLGDWRAAVADAEAAVRLAKARPATGDDARSPAPGPPQRRPDLLPRPSSSPPARSAARASAPSAAIAVIAPAPWTCFSKCSGSSPSPSAPGSCQTRP